MSGPGIVTPVTPELLRGAIEIEATEGVVRPHRLPAWARAQWPDDQLAMAESQPSGVRLAFRTTATAIELELLATKVAYAGLAGASDGVYDLVVDGRLAARATSTGGHLLTIDLTTGAHDLRTGGVGAVAFHDLPPGAKDVELWLSYTEAVELLALRTDAPVAPAAPSSRPTWVHHGSSISQGSSAAGPSTTWAALAAAAGGVELVNLGFAGSALLDPFVARTIRDTPADLISLKVGINLVNHDLMRPRAFGPAVHGWLDTIRDGHPSTPLLVVSPICCPMHEDVPGPSAPDLTGAGVRFIALGDPAASASDLLTLTGIRAELARIVGDRAASDAHLHHLDGLDLYGAADHDEHPLPDQLHPDAETHHLIAERFAACVFAPGGPFGA
ncbi:MAG TPA: SGNH/GDSL hydrolase family protein [Acidimicrobiales bacterium]